jgi:2-polyprenyl-3-methyl-5-hydroxy-6-metoxy-1,4-benzoquinol methylase
MDSWKNLEVLEIGCGEGNLASMISYAGAKFVYGIDYSQVAINNGNKRYNIKNVKLECKNYKELDDTKYDVVVLQGVLEHMDNPFDDLLTIIQKFVKPNGTLITSSPSFINPRGWVLMTLQILFDVPISLTDKYFLCPFDFEKFCKKNNLNLSFKSTYLNWASGDDTVRDFNRRLRNALRDANMDNSKVDKFLEWFSKTTKHFEHNDYTGAMVTYKITNM